jgi:hypothetical protein
MPFERSLSRTLKWARLWHYSTKNLTSMKMASCHHKCKNGEFIEEFIEELHLLISGGWSSFINHAPTVAL